MKCCAFKKIEDPKKKSLNDKISAIGWALFLVMIGGLLLVPEGKVPESAWLAGAGIIMLGSNAARYFSGLRLCGCTMGLGALLLASGICGFYGVEFPFFPAVLILVGISIIWGLVTKKK